LALVRPVVVENVKLRKLLVTVWTGVPGGQALRVPLIAVVVVLGLKKCEIILFVSVDLFFNVVKSHS
jgi:hypothetical protein